MKEIARHILGYTIGFAIFIVLIPFGINELAALDHRLWSIRLFDGAIVRLTISIPIFILGMVFAVWSNWALFRIGQGGPTDAFGVAVSPRTKELVVRGPYRLTRNPMVFGALSIYLSLGFFLNSVLCVAFVLIAFPLVVVYLKSTEEKRLAADFGSAFTDYRHRVPMIIPLPKFGRKAD